MIFIDQFFSRRGGGLARWDFFAEGVLARGPKGDFCRRGFLTGGGFLVGGQSINFGRSYQMFGKV